MKLTTYLEFDGTCAEAFAFYQEVLGAEPGMSMRFGDMPEQPDWVTPEVAERMAHAQITIGGQVVMASDTAGNEPFGGYKGFTLHLGFQEEAEARRIFGLLSEGGEVRMPLEPTFWSKLFGMCRDKFGVSWMIDLEDAG